MSKMSSKMKKKLAGANKKWKSTEGAASNSFVNENVADGQYVGDLKAAELREIGDKLAVEFKFEITEAGKDGDDDAVGEEVVSRFYIETEQNIGYLKAALYRFVEDRDQIDDLDLAEDLPDLLEAIGEEGPSCKLSVRTAGEFQNVYINKVEEGSGSGGDDDDDDDKPAKKKKKGKAKGSAGGKGGGKKGKGKPAADDDDSDDDDDDDSDDDDSDDDDDDDTPMIEKGDTVSFKPPRSKSAKECTVVKVKGDKLDLKDEDGNKYPGILASKVEAIDPDNDSDDDDDDDDADEKPAKRGKGKSKAPAKGKGKKAADDDDSDDDDDDADDDDADDEVEIDVGSKVAFPFKGKELTGKVVSIDEDNETVEVSFKDPSGKKVKKSFAADKLEAVR